MKKYFLLISLLLLLLFTNYLDITYLDADKNDYIDSIKIIDKDFDSTNKIYPIKEEMDNKFLEPFIGTWDNGYNSRIYVSNSGVVEIPMIAVIRYEIIEMNENEISLYPTNFEVDEKNSYKLIIKNNTLFSCIYDENENLLSDLSYEIIYKAEPLDADIDYYLEYELDKRMADVLSIKKRDEDD